MSINLIALTNATHPNEVKDEIQCWLNSNEGDLDHDTHWETADKYYGEELLTFPKPHHVVLRCGNTLGNALFFGEVGHMSKPSISLATT
jgi:hypothetical protein